MDSCRDRGRGTTGSWVTDGPRRGPLHPSHCPTQRACGQRRSLVIFLHSLPNFRSHFRTFWLVLTQWLVFTLPSYVHLSFYYINKKFLITKNQYTFVPPRSTRGVNLGMNSKEGPGRWMLPHCNLFEVTQEGLGVEGEGTQPCRYGQNWGTEPHSESSTGSNFCGPHH